MITESFALHTDLYQLTMAYGYWKSGMQDYEANFHLFFRKNPFGGGYSIACGLADVIEYLQNFRFQDDDLEYLASLKGNDDKALFEQAFLEYLKAMEFSCDLLAVPEGSVVFPHEPLIRITGPLIQTQILETPLLNLLNFPTLIATKASRICRAARGEAVLEFGLRRAQGMNGALTASRASYIGGCHATSNLLAGKKYDIPVKGTHAHSWVMSFSDEKQSFETYAAAMPNNCVFLVDTYDTIEGVKNAVEIGLRLKEQGYRMAGIRLDSGDLASLSWEARKILDQAGLSEASIVASNDLDEYRINKLKSQGAKINVWGVGTRLATAYDQPALGGVYKLSAIRKPGHPWEFKVKLSEQAIKVSNPGILQIQRFKDEEGNFAGDLIVDEEREISGHSFISFSGQKVSWDNYSFTNLLQPVFQKGELVHHTENIHQSRKHALEQLDSLSDAVKQVENPASYPVGLENGLASFKNQLIKQLRQSNA